MEKCNIFSMSYIRRNCTSASDAIENEHFPKDNDSNCDDDCDDTLSYADSSSSSDFSNYVCSSRKTDRRPSIVNIEPSDNKIGSACVTNSTHVTFGTVFNGPVVITNFVDGSNDVKHNLRDQVHSSKTGTEKTSDQKGVYCLKSNRHLMFCVLASVVVLVTAAIGAGYYLNVFYNFPTTVTVEIGDYFIDRDQYGALPPKTVDEPLSLPIKQIIISHTATPNCTNYSECTSRVLQIQRFHMYSKGWSDIGLNFLVGGDGHAYEGCGYLVGAHTYHYNRVSICIAFIGDFSTYAATEKQLEAAQRLIDDGIKMSKIHPDYVLYGQRQVNGFDSPGIMLYNQIILWSHWSEVIVPL